MSDDFGGIIGALFVGILILAAIIFIVVPILIICMGTGALFGGGYSIYNYGTAFIENVKPERIS
jgi:hypothetical protein